MLRAERIQINQIVRSWDGDVTEWPTITKKSGIRCKQPDTEFEPKGWRLQARLVNIQNHRTQT